MSKHAPKVPKSEWETQKQRIISLYSEPRMTLRRTIVLMKQRYGFDASESQYRTKLELWKVKKNATSGMWIWIDREIRRRASEGKATDVFLHRKKQPREKIAKEIARNVIFADLLSNAEMDSTPPEGITVATPPSEDVERHEESTCIQPLPWLQVWDDVMDIVTGIIRSTGHDLNGKTQNDDKAIEIILGTVLPVKREEDIPSRAIDKALGMWPKDAPPLNMMSCPLLPDHELSHDTRQGISMLALPLFLAINNRVGWGVLYSCLRPVLQNWSRRFLGYICTSKTPSSKILCRQILVPLEIAEYPGDVFDEREDIQMLSLLLEAGADPARVIQDETLGYALILAAERGSLDAVEVLLHHKANIKLYDPRKHGSALQAATVYGHYDIVEKLLHGHYDIVEGLPYRGADIEVPHRPEYQVLLHTAFHDPDCDVALVMERAARSPIQIAAADNNMELVKLLHSYGANLNGRPGIQRCQHCEARHDIQSTEADLDDCWFLTPLQYAVRNQNIDLVSFLLANNADPNRASDYHNRTPLQMAVALGSEKIVQLLLNAGAAVNAPAQGVGGRTALQAAAEAGSLAFTKLLIHYGANVNALGSHNLGVTAVQAAALGGKDQIFDLLLSAGADVYAQTAPIGGFTALQAAAAGGHAHIIKTLIRLGADGNSVGRHAGRTALQAVIQHKDHSILEAVIDYGANINAPPSVCCGTPLQEASKHRWLDGARYLLSMGADADARPHSEASAGNDLTALGWAIENDDLNMVGLLLLWGADVQCAPGHCSSAPNALAFALQRGKPLSLIKTLLERANAISTQEFAELALAAAINGHYNDTSVYELLFDQTALSLSLNTAESSQRAWDEILTSDYLSPLEQTSQSAVIKLLLDKGADINRLHPEKNASCLQVALHYGCRQIAEFLLERGASPDVPATAEIGTPLQEAIDRCYLDIIGMILETGADVNSRPARQNGRTALQMAARDGMFGLVARLLELGADVAASPAAEGGQTAIDCAAGSGCIDMVQMLLNAYRGDEAIRDVCDRAAGYAENEGHVEISEWLREYPS
ncbi:ankyrin repeat-containing domain protein [Aspergillus germanicus]